MLFRSPVREGDVLIELDTVITEADMARLTKERDFYVLDLARLFADREGKPFVPPQGGWDPEVVLHQQELSRTRQLEFRSWINVLKQQALMVVTEMVRRSRDMGAEPRLVGTMALRLAGNTPDFLRTIHDRTGLDLMVLTRKKEARLAWKGALDALAWPHRNPPARPALPASR